MFKNQLKKKLMLMVECPGIDFYTLIVEITFPNRINENVGSGVQG